MCVIVAKEKGIKMPDKNGVVQDVVLGWDDAEGYEKGSQRTYAV